MTFKLNGSPDQNPVAALLGDGNTMLDTQQPEAAPALDSVPGQANPLESANPFGGGDTFTGETERVAGLGSFLGKVGTATGKLVGKAAERSADDAAKLATKRAAEQVIKPPAVVAPKPAIKPVYDETKAMALLSKDPELPPNSRRTDSRNFNMKKLQTSDDIKALIDDVARQNDGFTTARRGVVTNEQTTREAASIDVAQLTGRKPAEAWNASQIKAGHELLKKAGVAPQGMASFFGKLAKQEQGTAPPALLSTHPASEERMKTLGKQIQDQGNWPAAPLPYDWTAIKAASS